MGIWSPILATAVGAFAFYVWRWLIPSARRRVEAVKGRMPTKQIFFEDKLRDLRRMRATVGLVVVVQAILSIVLWAQYLGR